MTEPGSTVASPILELEREDIKAAPAFAAERERSPVSLPPPGVKLLFDERLAPRRQWAAGPPQREWRFLPECSSLQPIHRSPQRRANELSRICLALPPTKRLVAAEPA